MAMEPLLQVQPMQEVKRRVLAGSLRARNAAALHNPHFELQTPQCRGCRFCSAKDAGSAAHAGKRHATAVCWARRTRRTASASLLSTFRLKAEKCNDPPQVTNAHASALPLPRYNPN